MRVSFDERYLRPSDVDALIGDTNGNRAAPGWKPQADTKELARSMVDADVAALQHECGSWIDRQAATARDPG